MRNLLLRGRDNQVWIDYSLDLIFIILLFANGNNGWGWVFILITLIDILLLAFFPDIEDKWWYRGISALVIVVMLIYIVLTVITFLGGDQVLRSLNLPLD